MLTQKRYQKFLSHLYKEFEPEIRGYGFASISKLIQLKQEGTFRNASQTRKIEASDSSEHQTGNTSGKAP